tara:strand:- start:175 stop:423 length:249 start_codon:yes stop_codon:yes gene_type:complete
MNKATTPATKLFTAKITDGKAIILVKIRPEFATNNPSMTAATLTTFETGHGASQRKMSRVAARAAWKQYMQTGWEITTKAID